MTDETTGDPRRATIGGWQVRPEFLTGYCELCGALLADIDAHLRWHDARGDYA